MDKGTDMRHWLNQVLGMDKGEMDMRHWLDQVLKKGLPGQAVEILFNLYEDGKDWWSLELAGTGSFDPENPDWGCEEVFATRENPYQWVQRAPWQKILRETEEAPREYLRTGGYVDTLKAYQGVGVGFVEGDIKILYQKAEKYLRKQLAKQGELTYKYIPMAGNTPYVMQIEYPYAEVDLFDRTALLQPAWQ